MTKSEARQLEIWRLRAALSSQEIMAQYRETPTMDRTQQDGRENRDDRGAKGPSDVAGSADLVAEVPKEIDCFECSGHYRHIGFSGIKGLPYLYACTVCGDAIASAVSPNEALSKTIRPQDVHPSDIPVGLVAYELR